LVPVLIIFSSLFLENLKFKNEPDSRYNKSEAPRDLREKLNRNRSERNGRNFETSNKTPEERWTNDLYDARKQAPKTRNELIVSHGYDIKEKETEPKVERIRKDRPERRINANDMIKLSLGLMQKPRKQLQEVKTVKNSEKTKDFNKHHTIDLSSRLQQITLKPNENLPETIKKTLNKIEHEPVKRKPNSRLEQISVKTIKKQTETEIIKEKEEQNCIQPKIYERIFNELCVQPTKKNVISAEASEFIPRSRQTIIQQEEKSFVQEVQTQSEAIETSLKSNEISKTSPTSSANRNVSSLMKLILKSSFSQAYFEEQAKSIPTEIEKPTDSNDGTVSSLIEIIIKNSSFRMFRNQETENLQVSPTKLPAISPINKKELVTHSSESLEKSTIIQDESNEAPIATNAYSGAPSKLHNRLSRARSISESSSSCLSSTPTIETSTSLLFPESFDSNSYLNFENTESFQTSTELQVDSIQVPTIPALPSNLTQSELDFIAAESLAKLTADQQTQLMYIENVPSKYFQSTFEYFVNYFVEIQCVPLDLDAVHSYLLSRGVAIAEIKPPTPFQHENFSFERKQTMKVQHQWKKEENPIKIVDPKEDEKTVLKMLQEIEIEQAVSSMFMQRN
jgi:hypothetical protein